MQQYIHIIDLSLEFTCNFKIMDLLVDAFIDTLDIALDDMVIDYMLTIIPESGY